MDIREELICPQCKKALKYTDGNAYDPQNRDEPHYYCKCGFKIYINIAEDYQERHKKNIPIDIFDIE